jgi:hypothetical protein
MTLPKDTPCTHRVTFYENGQDIGGLDFPAHFVGLWYQ